MVADYGNNNKAQSDIVSVEESYDDKNRKRTEGRKEVTDMAQSVAKLKGGNVQWTLGTQGAAMAFTCVGMLVDSHLGRMKTQRIVTRADLGDIKPLYLHFTLGRV